MKKIRELLWTMAVAALACLIMQCAMSSSRHETGESTKQESSAIRVEMSPILFQETR